MCVTEALPRTKRLPQQHRGCALDEEDLSPSSCMLLVCARCCQVTGRRACRLSWQRGQRARWQQSWLPLLAPPGLSGLRLCSPLMLWMLGCLNLRRSVNCSSPMTKLFHRYCSSLCAPCPTSSPVRGMPAYMLVYMKRIPCCMVSSAYLGRAKRLLAEKTEDLILHKQITPFVNKGMHM